MTTGFTKINDSVGYVSAVQIYQIMTWIETGYKISPVNGSIPKKEKEYIIKHFSLVYDKKKRRYTGKHEEVFNVFKNDYPKIMQDNNINSYTQLYYLATC